jgi:mannose/fructose/N-acetylgalactosamine-specific phosphotransferase system component IIC
MTVPVWDGLRTRFCLPVYSGHCAAAREAALAVPLIGIGMVGWMVAISYQAYQGNQNFGVSEQGESALFRVVLRCC